MLLDVVWLANPRSALGLIADSRGEMGLISDRYWHRIGRLQSQPNHENRSAKLNAVSPAVITHTAPTIQIKEPPFGASPMIMRCCGLIADAI